MKNYIFSSARLGFREWCPDDLEPFYSMCSDTEVMKYFLSTLDRDQTQDAIHRLTQEYKEHQYTFYAVDFLSTHSFIGFIGFYNSTFKSSFTPSTEIGWRLDKKYWGQGLASEGAAACISYAQQNLPFNEIYSFTPLQNLASERVMQKIGMLKHGEFSHPSVAKDHPLNMHHLYHLQW